MKTLLRIRAVFLVAALCSATVLPCAAQRIKRVARFVSPHGYAVSVPPGWYPDVHNIYGDDVLISQGRYSGAESQQSDACLRVGIVRQHLGETLDADQKTITAGYKKRLPNFVVVSQTHRFLDGIRAVELRITSKNADSSYLIHQVYTLRHGNLYTFTAICPAGFQAKYDPVLTQILNSVRWKA